MILHQTHIGIDVSKRDLDIFDPRCGHARIENTSKAIEDWLASLPGWMVIVTLVLGGFVPPA